MEQTASEDAARQHALKVVKAAYGTMMGAKDGFGDYVVWRDDFQPRLEANRELDTLRTEVWHLLMDTLVE